MCPSDHIPKAGTLKANFRHLYLDVFWYGVLAASSLAFLSIYATHLGATGFQIGLLTAAPAIINLLFSLPSGRWLEGRPLISTTFRASILYRSAYLVLVPLPWLLGAVEQTWALVALVGLMSIPGTALAIGFNAMFADVVPAEWRAHVVGRRNALLAISLTGTSLACAWLLEAFPFPSGYQIVFTVGVVGAAMSSYHLGRLRPLAGPPPPRLGRPLHDAARPGILRFGDTVRQAAGLRFLTRSAGRSLIRLDLISGTFGPFLAAYLFFYLVQFIPIPVFPLFWIRDLHLSDGAISIGNALFYVGMLLASFWLQRLSTRWGHRGVLVGSALMYGIYPLLNAQAEGAALYWVASLLGGGVWGILNGGLLNRLMERVPADDRPAHMALHNLVLNMGILIGSLLGPALGDTLGLRTTLLLGAALRIAAGFGLWIFA
jgi:hypothetical protein